MVLSRSVKRDRLCCELTQRNCELRRIASEVYCGGMDDVMDGTSFSAGIQSDLKKEGPQSTVGD